MQTINNQHSGAILGNRASYAHPSVKSCEKSPGSLPLVPRSHECDNKQTKKMTLLRRFACNTDFEPKKFSCMVNK